MTQPREARRRIRIRIDARQRTMSEKLAAPQNVSPEIRIAELAYVRNHDREQDQCRRVAPERNTSGTGGHHGIQLGALVRRHLERTEIGEAQHTARGESDDEQDEPWCAGRTDRARGRLIVRMNAWLIALLGFCCGCQRPFLSCGAGRKPTVRAAGMVMGALVRGLKPARARRRRTEKVPKPGTQKRLSLRIERAICSKARSRVVATCFLG